jgi:peptidoglycan/xylan/chitin deacetylase (PgdA/CDA1 family)
MRRAASATASGWRGFCRQSALIRYSAILHGLLLCALLLAPQTWRVLLALFLADHALLCVSGLLPRATLLGPNWNRLPAAAAARGQIALTIDDGPDPLVTPQLLEILERYQVRATFFCIGARAMAEPALCRQIVRAGHQLENHTQRHLHAFACLGPAGMAREIGAGQRALKHLSGQRPLFFRPPAGLRNPFLDPLLRRFGLRLASWTRRGYDTREPSAERVLQRLLKGLAAGDILLLHDGNSAHDARGQAVVLSVLPRLLEAILARGLHPVTLRAALDCETR